MSSEVGLILVSLGSQSNLKGIGNNGTGTQKVNPSELAFSPTSVSFSLTKTLIGVVFQ